MNEQQREETFLGLVEMHGITCQGTQLAVIGIGIVPAGREREIESSQARKNGINLFKFEILLLKIKFRMKPKNGIVETWMKHNYFLIGIKNKTSHYL